MSAKLLRGLRAARGNDLFGRLAGQLLHMVELMREAADPECQRTQFDDEVVQLALWEIGAHNIPIGPIRLTIEAENLAASPRYQPLDTGGESVRDRDVDGIDRLQQKRLALLERFLDRLAAGGLERHVRTVDRVELAGQ